MGGSAGNVRLLVMSDSVWDMMDRWSMVTRMARHDERLLEEFRSAEKNLRRLDMEASVEVKRQVALQQKRAISKRRVVSYYGRRTRELARLKRDKIQRRRLMKELGGSRDAMRDTIASLLKAKDAGLERQAALIDRMEGRLPWPVVGTPLVADSPGESRGIRIQAPLGTPIHPVAPGEVVFSDWVRGYGRLVILQHGGDIYTVYGGAEEVFVDKGNKVGSKQIIAHVGTTGAFGGPSLYFEIRRGSIPMEPLRWLSPHSSR
jgi:septal ring factor EnvC (AmiA/AmiB activator)